MTAAAATDDPSARAGHLHTVRVYWEDTDAGGVVFYANYLKYFERARSEWLRALGIGQQDLSERSGLIFVVSAARLRYRAPARLDDLLQISAEPTAIRRASLSIRQQARRAQDLLCEAEVEIACVAQSDFRPQRIPDALLHRLQPAHTRPAAP
jgi:acyl-CoA thioester hydrolase